MTVALLCLGFERPTAETVRIVLCWESVAFLSFHPFNGRHVFLFLFSLYVSHHLYVRNMVAFQRFLSMTHRQKNICVCVLTSNKYCTSQWLALPSAIFIKNKCVFSFSFFKKLSSDGLLHVIWETWLQLRCVRSVE